MKFVKTAIRCWCAVTLLGFASTHLRAEFIVEFGQGGMVQDTLLVIPGSQIEVQYFLSQTGGEMGLNTMGLGSFTLDVLVPMGSGLSFDPNFNFVDGLDTDTFELISANELRAGGFGDPATLFTVIPVTAGPGVNSILLGSSLLNIAPSFTGSVTLSAPQNVGAIFTLGPDPSDSVTVSPGMASVTAIPEPSTWALTTVAGVCGILRRFRRRRTIPS